MARTRSGIIDNFRRRYPACDATRAGDLFTSVNEMICRRIPVAVAFFKKPITNSTASYFLDPTDVSGEPWVFAPTSFNSQSAIAAQQFASVSRILVAHTIGYSTDKRLDMSALDMLHETSGWNTAVDQALTGASGYTASDVPPDRIYTSSQWRANTTTQYGYGLQYSLSPIPVISGVTGFIAGACQVVPYVNGSSDYIPAQITTEEVYIDGMCYLWSKEEDRSNIPSWFTLFENSIKQEQWHYLNQSRFQSKIFPAGYNLRDQVQ